MVLTVEQLDERINPSVTYDPGTNTLTVTGTPANDAIYVNWAGSTVIMVKVNGAPTFVSDPAINAATLVVANGLDGADNIQIVGSLESVVYGGAGNDVITGGNARDIIFGGAGDDNIQGGAGDDALIGGAGRDRLSGGSGLDIEFGGEIVDAFYSDPNNLRVVSQNWAVGSPDAVLAAGWSTIMIDTEVDRFTAGLDADWFLGQVTDIYTDYVVGLDLRTGPVGPF